MSKVDISEVEEFVLEEEDEPEIKCGQYDKYKSSEEFFPCKDDQYCDVEEEKCVHKSVPVEKSYQKYPLDPEKRLLFFGNRQKLTNLGKKYKEIKAKEFDERDRQRLEKIAKAEEARVAELQRAEEEARVAELQRAEEEARVAELQRAEELERIKKAQAEAEAAILLAEQKELEEIRRLEKIKEKVKKQEVEKEAEKLKEVEKEIKAEKKEEKFDYFNKTLDKKRLMGAVFHRIYSKYLNVDIDAEELYNEIYRFINVGEKIVKEPKTIDKIKTLIEYFKNKKPERQLSLLAEYNDIDSTVDIDIDLTPEDIKTIEEKTGVPIIERKVEVRIDGEDKLFSRFNILKLIKELEYACENPETKKYTTQSLLEVSREYNLGIKEDDTKYRKPYYKKEDLCNEISKRLRSFLDSLPEAKIDKEQEQLDNQNFSKLWNKLKVMSSEIKECTAKYTLTDLKQIIKEYKLDVTIKKEDKKADVCKKVAKETKKEYRRIRDVVESLLEQKEEEIKEEIKERPLVLEIDEKELERQAEAEKLEAEQEKLEAERVEAERKAEQEKLETERVEAERKAEQEKLEAERKEAERKAEQEKLEAERLESERKAEQEKLEAERKAEQEKLEAERKAEQEKLEAERKEAERKAALEEKVEIKETIQTRKIKDLIDRTIDDIKVLRREGRLEFELYKLPKRVAVCTGLSI